MLIDTHCHLDLPPLFEQLGLLLDEAAAAGVSCWVVPSICPDSWQRIAALSARIPALRPAYGIHPLYASEATEDSLQQLEQLVDTGVAIGEIGLDGTYGQLTQQEWLFRKQLRIARHYGLPVLIHCRQAMGRVISILHEEQAADVGGIMHAFSGSLESARECIRMGFAIGISGSITRSNAIRPLLLARELPLESLVIETDAPDMTPATRQNEPNRPAWLLDVATALAQARNTTLEEIGRGTSATAQRVIPKL